MLRRMAAVSSSTPLRNTGKTGVLSTSTADCQTLRSPSTEPLKLSCMVLAAAAALPSALRSFSVSSSRAPMPWFSSARKAGPASRPTALMAFAPAGPLAASWRKASSKSSVTMPAAPSSLRKALAGLANWLSMLFSAVPARLASMPASANLPMIATVLSRLMPSVLATGAA